MNTLQKIRRIFHKSAISALWRWSGPVRKPVLWICVISLLSTLGSLGIPLVTKSLIDGATASDSSALWTFGILLVALFALMRVFAIANAHIRNVASAEFQREIQGMVTDAILGKEYSYIKGYHSGELTNRVFSDVSVVKNGILTIIPNVLKMLVSFVGAAAILITMDWRFLPVILVVCLLGLVLSVLFRNPMKRRHKRMQAAEDALHASTQETLENIRIVKASVSEERAISSMDERRERLSEEQIRNGRLSNIMNQGMGTIFDISWLVCHLWGCVRIFQGTFTYGSLAALIQLVNRIQGPIANAVGLVTQLYGVVASAERLQDVVGLPDEEAGTELSDFDEIRLHKVTFQYAESRENVLEDVNAAIRKGDFVALTGISGGGKTSLFQLLLGIYKPTGGSVQFILNGKTYLAAKGTRSLFAYVPQGNTLMSGSLRENICMFTDHPTEERLESAVRAACLEDLVGEIGLDAKLGERGIGLSEGQAQRVAIARALLSDAPILLLDEATSALDEQTEARLLENIDAMRDKTVIIVTHRRAALAICDYQLYIENGRMTRVEGTARPI